MRFLLTTQIDIKNNSINGTLDLKQRPGLFPSPK